MGEHISDADLDSLLAPSPTAKARKGSKERPMPSPLMKGPKKNVKYLRSMSMFDTKTETEFEYESGIVNSKDEGSGSIWKKSDEKKPTIKYFQADSMFDAKTNTEFEDEAQVLKISSKDRRNRVKPKKSGSVSKFPESEKGTNLGNYLTASDKSKMSEYSSSSPERRRVIPDAQARRNLLKLNKKTEFSSRSELPVAQTARLDKPSFFRVEVFCSLVFIFSIIAALLVAFLSQGEDLFSNVEEVELDGVFTGDLETGGVFPVKIQPLKGQTIIISLGGNFDTTLTLRTLDGDFIDFNDDSFGSLNSSLFFSSGSGQAIIAEVRSFASFSGGIFELSVEVVQEQVLIDGSFNTTLSSDKPLIAQVLLNKGVTYHIYVFSLDLDVAEVDSVIKLKDGNGDDIFEVFQTTLFEQTASAVFTPPKTGLFNLEVGLLSGFDVNISILVKQAQVTELELATSEAVVNFENLPLKRVVSNVLEFDLKANVNYTFDFDFEFNDVISEEEINRVSIFGVGTQGVVEALSFRLYDKDKGTVLQRTQSDFLNSTVNTSTLLEVESFYYYNYGDYYDYNFYEYTLNGIDFIVGETRLNVLPRKSFTALLEVNRMHPDFLAFENGTFGFEDDDLVGSFNLTVSIDKLSRQEAREFQKTVDVNNLFEECEVDQTKLTSEEGCSQGIVLFCTNEFFALRDFEQATTEQFSEICECIDFLCVSLQGDAFGNDYSGYLVNVLSGIFATVCGALIIFYFGSMIELLYHGIFKDFFSRGFQTWTILAFYFFCAMVLFITQILLSGEFQELDAISQDFDSRRIPRERDFNYYYYDRQNAGLIRYGDTEYYDDDFGYYDYYYFDYNDENAYYYYVGVIGDTLLNNDTLARIPRDKTYDSIKFTVIANQLAFVLQAAVASISFLDIGVVWLRIGVHSGLNKGKLAKKFKRVKICIRSLQIVFALYLIGYCIAFTLTSGESYSVLPNILLLLVSIFVIFLFLLGRSRLKRVFLSATLYASAVSGDSKKSRKVWENIRVVSTIIVVANFGIALVQIFLITEVQEQADLVKANNDPFAVVFITFLHGCYLIGALAAFYYIFHAFEDYKKLMFEDPDAAGEGDVDYSSKYNTKNFTGENTLSVFQRSEFQTVNVQY